MSTLRSFRRWDVHPRRERDYQHTTGSSIFQVKGFLKRKLDQPDYLAVDIKDSEEQGQYGMNQSSP